MLRNQMSVLDFQRKFKNANEDRMHKKNTRERPDKISGRERSI